MISIGGLLLGLVNIGIVVAVLILVGLLIVWLLSWLGGVSIPDQIKKVYMVIVALIAVYMVVALLIGLPTYKIIGGDFFRLPSAPAYLLS